MRRLGSWDAHFGRLGIGPAPEERAEDDHRRAGGAAAQQNAQGCPCGCGRPVDPAVRGESAELYATVRCAWELHDWPACLECQDDPQDPILAPFCCPTCEASFASRIVGLVPGAARA